MKSERGGARRWIEGAAGGDTRAERAAKLLRQVRDPAPLGAVELARIGARLDEKAIPWSRRALVFWWLGYALPTAALAVLVAVVLHPWRPGADRRHEVVAARCQTMRLAIEGQARVSLRGPGRASVGERRVSPVRLDEGRLYAESGAEPLVVAAGARARVLLRPRSTVEIELRGTQLRVAAYVGGAAVEWLERNLPVGAPVAIEAGNALGAEGPAKLEPGRADEVRRILSGEANDPGDRCEPERPAPPPGMEKGVAGTPPPSPPPAAQSRKEQTASRRTSLEPTRGEVPAKPALAVLAIDERRSPAASMATSHAPPAPATRSAPSGRFAETGHPALERGSKIAEELEPERAAEPAIPSRRPPVEPPPTPPPAAAPSALGDETRLLGDALRKLRHDQDAAGALAALDAYRARFPHGTLQPEADVARVDALLILDRRRDALVTLDAMKLSGLARARELHVLRGELRAAADRCPDAIRDFDETARLSGDPLEERALYGRASCRARKNEWERARADLTRYLERFPQGRFSAAARHALEGKN